MTDGPHSPKRARMDACDLSKMSREELIEKVREQNEYMALLESRHGGRHGTADDDESRENEESLKKQNMEAARRENTLVLRLTSKEQELQECMSQITEMKQSQTQSVAQLRQMLLDPAVNLVYQRMAREMDKLRENLKQTQNDLSAWKFTPDSQTGKRLMAKCRMLLQENEDLGKMINSGRTAKLEGEIAMQKNLVQEMKSNQSEMEQLVAELEEDMEGLQSMIYALQRQLKETREQLARSQAENASLCQQLQSQSVAASAVTAASASASGGAADSLPPGGDRHLGTGPGGAGDARTSDAQAARTFSEDVDMEMDTGGGGTKGEEGGLREGEEEMEHADSFHPPLGGPGREAGQPLPDDAAARDCKGRTGGGSSNSPASQQHFNHRGEAGRTGAGEEEEEEGRTWEAREAQDTGSPPSASAGDFTPPPLTNSDAASQLPGLGEKRTALGSGEDVLEESDSTEPISNGVSTDPPTAPSESGEEGGQLSV